MDPTGSSPWRGCTHDQRLRDHQGVGLPTYARRAARRPAHPGGNHPCKPHRQRTTIDSCRRLLPAPPQRGGADQLRVKPWVDARTTQAFWRNAASALVGRTSSIYGYAAFLQNAGGGRGRSPGRCPGLVCGVPLGHRVTSHVSSDGLQGYAVVRNCCRVAPTPPDPLLERHSEPSPASK